MRPKKCIPVILILVCSYGFSQICSAQNRVKSSVSGNGGTSVAGNNNRIVGTLGQPFVAVTGNSSYTGKVGFWYQAVDIVTSVEQSDRDLGPTVFHLGQNYPNPFNPTTTMLFSLPRKSHVKLDIYNMRGQKVRALLNEERPAGFYEARWNGRDDNGVQVSSGVYLYRIKADGFFQTRKMIFMK